MEWASPWQVHVYREGLPGGRGWDSPSLGSPCEQPSCGKLTETRLWPLWSRSQLALLRSVSGPSKGPVQEGNPTSSAYAWGEGLWVSSFSSLESLDCFSLIVTMTVQAPGIAFHHPTPKGPNPDTLLPTK